MANVITPPNGSPNGRSLTIENLSENWFSSEHLEQGRMQVVAVELWPGAPMEQIYLRQDSLDGQKEIRLTSIDGSEVGNTLVVGDFYDPVINIDDCSVSSGTAIVKIWYKQTREKP